jgi:hypothetical protein
MMLSSSSVTYTLTPPAQSLNPSEHYIPVSPSKRKHPDRKRVAFEQDGIHFYFPHLLTIALRMAEKHETNPSTTRRSKYRKTVDLRSASGWTKWNLDLFNAKFEKHKYTDLRSYLGEDAYRMDPQFDEGKTI